MLFSLIGIPSIYINSFPHSFIYQSQKYILGTHYNARCQSLTSKNRVPMFIENMLVETYALEFTYSLISARTGKSQDIMGAQRQCVSLPAKKKASVKDQRREDMTLK